MSEILIVLILIKLVVSYSEANDGGAKYMS